MAITVCWRNGTIEDAASPARLLKNLADDPWNNVAYSEIKSVLSDRAWIISQTVLDPELSATEFLREMERAGICQILRLDEEHV